MGNANVSQQKIVNSIKSTMDTEMSSKQTCEPKTFLNNNISFRAPAGCKNATFKAHGISQNVDMKSLQSCVQNAQMSSTQAADLTNKIKTAIENQTQSIGFSLNASESNTNVKNITDLSNKIVQTYQTSCNPSALLKNTMVGDGYCTVDLEDVSQSISADVQMKCMSNNAGVSQAFQKFSNDVGMTTKNTEKDTVTKMISAIGKDLLMPFMIIAVVVAIGGGGLGIMGQGGSTGGGSVVKNALITLVCLLATIFASIYVPKIAPDKAKPYVRGGLIVVGGGTTAYFGYKTYASSSEGLTSIPGEGAEGGIVGEATKAVEADPELAAVALA